MRGKVVFEVEFARRAEALEFKVAEDGKLPRPA